mmetsp:Transcript_19103/g.32714  ORF Transcript_19103/g.32714 Transcript_19103/m.32714 type:complete len:214 (-) Transcript_19103:392-1033(-)
MCRTQHDPRRLLASTQQQQQQQQLDVASQRAKLHPRYTELADDLVVQLGRLGQKAGKGWYDYNPAIGKGRKPIPSKEVTAFVQQYIGKHQQQQQASKQSFSREAIVERVIFPLVNEGFKILEEGLAQRPSDIDVVYLYGYGWPAWRGGPMYWADHEVGLPRLLDTLRRFHRELGNGHPNDYFRPSTLLEQCVELNMTLEDYWRQRNNNNNNNN